MSGLKFKTEAEFERWQRSLADKPRLRVAASLGRRVEINEHEARVVLTAVPAEHRRLLPSRAAVERATRVAIWTVIGVSTWGASLCLAALWGMHHPVGGL